MSPLPAPIERLYSYTSFQQGQGDNSFPGTRVDADFDQTNNAIDALLSALGSILRSDGVLANGSVTRNALAADIRLGLGASHPWKTGQAYAPDDTVTSGYGLYVCLEAHTASAAFNSDLILGRWELLADLSQAVTLAPGSIGTAAFGDRSVTEPKLADSAASDRVIADGALRRRHASSSFGLVPVGFEGDFAGLVPPTGWLFCAGQAVSRTTYADLFAALSAVVTATATSGQNTLAAVSANLTEVGIFAAQIEGPGIQPGTTVLGATGNTLTLSAPATTNTAGATYRVMPWGRGDGATTFNLPDRRGRVTVGRDNVGGPAAGRLTTFLRAADLASTGGSDGEILIKAHLPAVMPDGYVTVSYPPHNYVAHEQLATASLTTASGSAPVINLQQGTANAQTGVPNPVLHQTKSDNPGGGQAHSTLQPSGVANRIIFAGV